MSSKVTLGGDRLGSGKKQKIHLRSYERSTHDLSYKWKSTMSAGTLVPFMTEIALPSDNFEIKLNADCLTHPTIGPNFDSFKIQLDVFQIPIRLYQASLMFNKLNIGMEMDKVALPQMRLEGNLPQQNKNIRLAHVNPSSLLSYLGISGIGSGGRKNATDPNDTRIKRDFMAGYYIAYFDIFKNYYANKQEPLAYMIHNELKGVNASVSSFKVIDNQGNPFAVQDETQPEQNHPFSNTYEITAEILLNPYDVFNADRISLYVFADGGFGGVSGWYPLTECFANINFDNANNTLFCSGWLNPQNAQAHGIYRLYWYRFDTSVMEDSMNIEPNLYPFPLNFIDRLREEILQHPQDGTPYIIDKNSDEPYRLPFHTREENGVHYYSAKGNQEGLLVKAYQSDYFNNWVQTDWIDGVNGINQITAVQVTNDEFLIDELNLQLKIYKMLMRVGVSGGSFRDWQQAVYDEEGFFLVDSPVYYGGLIKELAFQEIISNAETDNQPLGTLAGRGRLTNKNKGGKVYIKVKEPSMIMGICHLTPRINYSQGNKWDTNLKTLDDLHKPQLDQIGFQNLITDQMAFWDTIVDVEDNALPQFKSAGKQPSWTEYMTNVDVVKGNFALETEQMWMTNNRNYTPKFETANPATDWNFFRIQDLTTYIDPVKYNHIFAYTRRDAQNFWMQINVDMKVRRKISAKVMPNI